MKYRNKTSATIVADSVSQNGSRLTTFTLVMPRIILSEASKHRVFTMSSQSSRAVPFKTMLKTVRTDPFVPINFMRDHKGMQGKTYFTNKFTISLLIFLWLRARDCAMLFAWLLNYIGLTKQMCNRLLEPFMWHEIIVSATDYENFFTQRCAADAEIHIQDLAIKMRIAMEESTPTLLRYDEYHIPFRDEILAQAGGALSRNELIIHSIAKCARISYNKYNQRIDYDKDLALVKKLIKDMHMTPLEHVASPVLVNTQVLGNFKRYKQFRHNKTLQKQVIKQ